MNKETKLRIHNITAKTALKFGSEAWVLKKREEQRLEAAQMKFLRQLLVHNTYFEGTFWPQNTNNIIYLCIYYGAIRRHFGKQINKQTNEQRNKVKNSQHYS